MPKKIPTGYSMIEILITLTIVAILTAVAVPSYRAHVVRTQRIEAIEALLDAARCQEQLYVNFNAYDPDQCEGTAGNNLYTISVTTTNGGQNFVATATAIADQGSDACGILTLSDTGVQTAHGNTGAYAQKCWAGKSVNSSS